MAYTTLAAAADRAATLAVASQSDRHVVRDFNDDGGVQYAIASDYDLDTFFDGAVVLATAQPCGEVVFA